MHSLQKQEARDHGGLPLPRLPREDTWQGLQERLEAQFPEHFLEVSVGPPGPHTGEQ